METFSSEKETRHQRVQAASFHLCEMSQIEKSIETESWSVIARHLDKGAGEGPLNACGVKVKLVCWKLSLMMALPRGKGCTTWLIYWKSLGYTLSNRWY